MLVPGLLMMLAISPAPQDLPSYMVKIFQERTLFASDEPAWIVVRLGNQTQKALKSKKFPDLLAGLKVTRDDTVLKHSDQYSGKLFYKKLPSLKYGAHRDFRLDLRKYFPDMEPGAVYHISYHDENYDVTAKPVSITTLALPNLEAAFVLETSKGDITLKLDPEQAPNHSRNFALLTAMSFYQDMIFHRVVEGFVIQTGDPLGNGMGGSGYAMALEKSPFLKHRKYALGMARGDAEDSATSQFYICLERIKELDEGYTVFGEVVDGFDVVDAIGAAQTTGRNGEPPNKPLEDIKLISVKVKEP